jgi:hypothetical protein
MTLTFNPEQYTELLVKYQPKVIETEQKYHQFLTVVEYFVFKKRTHLRRISIIRSSTNASQRLRI